MELERGIQLFNLGRYKEALPFFQKELEVDPQNFDAKYFLALSYFNEGNYEVAEGLNNQLLSEFADHDPLYALSAQILLQQNKLDKALHAINIAIGMNPLESEYFLIKGAILLDKKSFKDSLQYIDKALELDAKNKMALNLRAQVLTKLGDKVEAQNTLNNLLNEDPEDSFSHANVGWVSLEQGKIKQALNHFKEALRLDPNDEYAREGMSTALKSKNPFYNLYLRYSFWISKQNSRSQWIFIIGIYIAYRFSSKLLTASGFTYLAIPLMLLYLTFALGGWIMESISNTILNFDSYGKFLLKNDERLNGWIFLGLLLGALICSNIYFFLGVKYFMIVAIGLLCALIPLPNHLLMPKGKAKSFSLLTSCLMIGVSVIGPFFLPGWISAFCSFGLLIIYTWVFNFINT